MAAVMGDGEGRSMPESVEVSEAGGGYESGEKQEDENLSPEREEGSGKPEDPAIQNPLENIEVVEEEAPVITSESAAEPSTDILVPDDEEEASSSNEEESSSSDEEESSSSDEEEVSSPRGASEDGDHTESVSTSEQPSQVEEGPTTQLEEERENLERGFEDSQALPEIADGLSHPPDTGSEDVDAVDLSDLFGPKPLDFDVIDFDQFGPQPPDLSLRDIVDNEGVENQYGGIASPNGGKGAGESNEVMKPEDQSTYADIDIADSGVEQEMKTLNDGLTKASLENASGKERLQKERGSSMDFYHIVPDRTQELQLEDNLPSFVGAEDNVGHDVPRDLDSQPIPERNGTSELQPAETVNPESIDEGSFQKRAEELNQLTQEQAKQLDDVRHQVQLSTAQLQEQSEIREEVKRDLEAEINERLKSEAKLMVLNEILPNMEEKLKDLSNQVLLLEGQLQEQVDLRNKLEGALQQERDERVQHVAQEEEQTRLQAELAHTLEEERDGQMKSEADLKALREMLSSSEGKLKDLHDQVESLVARLQDQTELRKGLEEKLGRECEERMHYLTKIEELTKTYEELALKLEEERDERLKSETSLKELRENLSIKEEELQDLHNQVVSLTSELQEQIERKKELEDKLDHEPEQRMQDAVMVSDDSRESLPVSSVPWSEEKLEFAALLDEQKTLLANQVLEAENLKSEAQMKVGLLNHQVQNLEMLTDTAESMEHAFNAKERAIKQALWTVFQVVCLGLGFMQFVVAYTDSVRTSLQPT